MSNCGDYAYLDAVSHCFIDYVPPDYEGFRVSGLRDYFGGFCCLRKRNLCPGLHRNKQLLCPVNVLHVRRVKVHEAVDPESEI